MKTHTIELPTGYTDSKDTLHKELVFGRRVTGGDLMRISESDMSTNTIGFQCAIFAAALKSFGTLNPAGFLGALLSLDGFERSEVIEAYDGFERESVEGRAEEQISDNTIRLRFGIVRDGVAYTDVTFGRRLIGWDSVNAERRYRSEARRNAYLVGKQVTKIASADGAQVVEGPLEVSDFETMDAMDLVSLREASERWNESDLAKILQARAAREKESEVSETVN